MWEQIKLELREPFRNSLYYRPNNWLWVVILTLIYGSYTTFDLLMGTLMSLGIFFILWVGALTQELEKADEKYRDLRDGIDEEDNYDW